MDIFFCGDIHGNVNFIIDFLNHCDKDEDILIFQLGDAGINFYLNESDTEKKAYLQRAIDQCSCKVEIAFVRGNHDFRPQKLYSYEEKPFYGGEAYVESDYPGLVFLKDGETYTVDNRQYLVIGGGYSMDWFNRMVTSENVFFSDEELSIKERNKLLQHLPDESVRNLTVLSHMLPGLSSPVEYKRVRKRGAKRPDTEVFLEEIYFQLFGQINRWVAAHYHQEMHMVIDGVVFDVFDVEKIGR